MKLWGKKKWFVEQMAKERVLTCHNCGPSRLKADEAHAAYGVSDHGGDAFLECQKCYAGVSLDLSTEDAKRLGLDRPWGDDPEAAGSRAF